MGMGLQDLSLVGLFEPARPVMDTLQYLFSRFLNCKFIYYYVV